MGILEKTAYVLREAAFGDIRNIFNSGDLYNFRMRPIGLYNKSYGFMLDHLYRNIGNAEYVYDGYSTPIGELANPFYNTITRVPWFYDDYYKNSTANYLDYMRVVYGAALSVENINDNNLFHLSDDASAVGYVDGIYAIEAIQNGLRVYTNVNETGTDTKLGLNSGYYNTETLRNAIVTNDERQSFKNSITSNITDYLGLTTNNVVDKKTYRKVSSPLTGRFVDGVFSPLEDTDSPVNVSNYGHSGDIGAYVGYYNSLGEKTKEYYNKNVYEYNLYYPSILNNGTLIKGGATRDIQKDSNGNIIGGTGDWIKGGTYLSSLNILIGYENLKKKKQLTKIEEGLDVKAIDELQIRYVFSTLAEHSNIVNYKDAVYVYAEDEYGSSPDITYLPSNTGMRFGHYSSYGNGLTANDLLKKTNTAFKDGRYKTIISRFHTNPTDAEETDTTQTAISRKYGLSHGRNLLKLTPDYSPEGGYENPYCRVWTYHHQYHTLNDAIRPFEYSADELYDKYNFKEFTAYFGEDWEGNGRKRLEKHGVLNKNNGLVNITPIDTAEADKKVDIKNCMFSIENLAWKDVFSTDASSRSTFQSGGLSAEQKGPFGGRIMWFPPYDLKFNEDINVNWNETNFIGRGEGIYTYTNTTRSGNLSFKILVDHPSIIDYWEGKGKSVSNSVDDKDDPEQQLLRFFAGCDMLTAKSMPTPEAKQATKDEPVPTKDTEVVKFFVFYPNDYSGVDDGYDFALKYLTNGLGAGKVLSETTSKLEDYQIPYAKATVNGNIKGYGGYEMRPGFPISLGKTEQTEQPSHYLIGKAKVGNMANEISLYAQEGDSTNTWWKRKWYYRVDNSLKNEDLLKKNYIDTTCSGLNSIVGKGKVADHFGISNNENLFSLSDFYIYLEGGDARNVLSDIYPEGTLDTTLSSLELKIGNNGSNIDHVVCLGMASVQGYDKKNKTLALNRAKTVANWLKAKLSIDGNKITATLPEKRTGGKDPGVNKGDDNALVNKLWRCAEVDIYLKKSESKTVQDSETEGYRPVSDGYKEGNIVNTVEQSLNAKSGIGIGDLLFNDLSANIQTEFEHYKDRVRSIRLNHLNDGLNNLAMNLRESSRHGTLNINSVVGAVEEFSEHYKKYQYDNLGFIRDLTGPKSSTYESTIEMNDKAAQSENAALNNSQLEKVDNAFADSERTKESTVDANNSSVTRYDNEAKFFYLLEKNEPFLHHKISDKIKYFDPAFHSISPEGFNARLTFLQQCTRQGPTIGNSDNGNETTANNLSFGRPPVCILRIGDFYYTKILIDNISISFDPLMWDLNSEGIGVMPMIADINMRFKFIGGSSLAGHITRLQNALSFNYYANTEVYDNRSELADYDSNGNIDKFKPNPLT